MSGKPDATHDRATSPGRAPRVGWLVVNLALLVVIVGGVAYLLLGTVVQPAIFESNAPNPVAAAPPKPVYEVGEGGVRVARVDIAQLTRWCRSVDLPDPPEIPVAEATVAEKLLGAMQRAAKTRAAADFGVVGQICESLDCPRTALEYFALAAKNDPGDYRWQYYLGCLHQDAGGRDKAIEAFLSVLKLNADYAMTHARLGQLYLEADRLDDAQRQLERYEALQPTDWLGAVTLGRVALARDDLDAALGHLERALQLGPNDFQVHYYLGRVYAARGETQRARQHFDFAARLPRGLWFRTRDRLLQETDALTGSVATLVEKFERLEGTRDWPALARLAEQIIERRPGDVTMMVNLTTLHRHMKHFADAHAVVDRALRSWPNSARLHVARGEVFFAERKLDAAIASCEKAIELEPEIVGAHNVLGRAYLLLKRPAEAEAAMRRAVELDPDDPGKNFVLGEVLRTAGKLAEAAAQYRRVLELQPNHPHAAKRLAAITPSGR